jgi:hypothetical protein
LLMRMDWGLDPSTANSWKDTMLDIWCCSWPAWAKTVKGKKKKKNNNKKMSYVMTWSFIRSEYSHTHKKKWTAIIT